MASAFLLPRRRPSRRAAFEGIAGPATTWTPAPDRPSHDPGRDRIGLDRLDERRISLYGDRRTRQINRFLSTVHTYLGLFRSHGQRVFVQIGTGWQLLDIPSAFEMSPDTCRWIYRHAGGRVQVRAEAHSEPHELTLFVEVLSGPPTRFLVSHHIARMATTAVPRARRSGIVTAIRSCSYPPPTRSYRAASRPEV